MYNDEIECAWADIDSEVDALEQDWAVVRSEVTHQAKENLLSAPLAWLVIAAIVMTFGGPFILGKIALTGIAILGWSALFAVVKAPSWKKLQELSTLRTLVRPLRKHDVPDTVVRDWWIKGR